MNKSIIVGVASVVMVGVFVVGTKLYQDKQAEKVSQIAATDTDSPFNRPSAP